MFSRKMIPLFATMIFVLGLAPAAHSANLVNIDLQPTLISNTVNPSPTYVGVAAGGFPGTATDYWNTFDVGVGYPTPPPTFVSNQTLPNLKLTDGSTNSGISFSVLASPGSPASYSGYSVTGSDDLRDDAFWLYAGGTSVTVSWQLSGLDAGTTYDLNMFGWVSGTYIGTWAVANSSLSASPQTTGTIATFLDVVPNGSNLISGTFTLPGNALQSQTFWTGMQFQFEDAEANGVPEPSTFVLAALGLAGLVAWRRRKANVECGMWIVE